MKNLLLTLSFIVAPVLAGELTKPSGICLNSWQRDNVADYIAINQPFANCTDNLLKNFTPTYKYRPLLGGLFSWKTVDYDLDLSKPELQEDDNGRTNLNAFLNETSYNPHYRAPINSVDREPLEEEIKRQADQNQFYNKTIDFILIRENRQKAYKEWLAERHASLKGKTVEPNTLDSQLLALGHEAVYNNWLKEYKDVISHDELPVGDQISIAAHKKRQAEQKNFAEMACNASGPEDESTEARNTIIARARAKQVDQAARQAIAKGSASFTVSMDQEAGASAPDMEYDEIEEAASDKEESSDESEKTASTSTDSSSASSSGSASPLLVRQDSQIDLNKLVRRVVSFEYMNEKINNVFLIQEKKCVVDGEMMSCNQYIIKVGISLIDIQKVRKDCSNALKNETDSKKRAQLADWYAALFNKEEELYKKLCVDEENKARADNRLRENAEALLDRDYKSYQKRLDYYEDPIQENPVRSSKKPEIVTVKQETKSPSIGSAQVKHSTTVSRPSSLSSRLRTPSCSEVAALLKSHQEQKASEPAVLQASSSHEVQPAKPEFKSRNITEDVSVDEYLSTIKDKTVREKIARDIDRGELVGFRIRTDTTPELNRTDPILHGLDTANLVTFLHARLVQKGSSPDARVLNVSQMKECKDIIEGLRIQYNATKDQGSYEDIEEDEYVISMESIIKDKKYPILPGYNTHIRFNDKGIIKIVGRDWLGRVCKLESLVAPKIQIAYQNLLNGLALQDEEYESYIKATNNISEMSAIVKGLQKEYKNDADKSRKLHIFFCDHLGAIDYRECREGTNEGMLGDSTYARSSNS